MGLTAVQALRLGTELKRAEEEYAAAQEEARELREATAEADARVEAARDKVTILQGCMYG